MRIEVEDNDSMNAVWVCHGDERLSFNTSVYNRATKASPKEIFKHINEYWGRLSEARQSEIFDTYRKIHNTLETVMDNHALIRRLMDLVKAFYQLQPLSEIRQYVDFYSDIKVPGSLRTEYDPDDIHERTYLRNDYMGLVVLAVALRPMVPIWGEFIRKAGVESGTTYKEYMAMRILQKSHLINSEPMERLYIYVESSVPSDTTSLSAVLNGLGSAEMPSWLLSLAVVRRLAVGEVSAADDRSSIITNIYNFVFTNTLNSLDRKFKGKVIEKHRTMSTSETDKASRVEAYKVKQVVSDGDIVVLGVYTQQVQDMAATIDPSIDARRVKQCCEFIGRLSQLHIQDHHITIAQWVVAPAISPRGVPHLNKPALLRVLGVVQAILWHWGFADLAVILTATPASRDDDGLMTMEGRSRIPKELVERLMQLYPYYQPPGGKPTKENIEQRQRQGNPAIQAIEALSKSVSFADWESNAPTELLKDCTMIGATRRFVAPPNLRAQLAELIVRIATRDEWLTNESVL